MHVMNKKGQALIEFVIILPVLILLMLAIVDIGIILYNQNSLESQMEEVVGLYKNGTDYEIKNIIDEDTTYSTNDKDKYVEISLSKEINLITPGLNLIFGNPYSITTKRTITNE